MRDFKEIIKEPHFVLRVSDLLFTLAGSYYLTDITSYKNPVKNVIAYTSLSGGVISAGLLVASYIQDERNAFYEKSLLAIYGLLNLLASYMFFTEIKEYSCYAEYVNPIVFLALACFLAGSSMIGDVGLKVVEEKRDEGGPPERFW